MNHSFSIFTLILTFKVTHCLAPDYIGSLVSLQRPGCYALRRNNELRLKPFSKRTLKTLDDRAFSVASLSLFNALPHLIRHENNCNRFKSLLKTFFIQNCI